MARRRRTSEGESDRERLLRIAELYYVHGLTQDEIATRLRTSRPWISRLLHRAEEAGLVRIQVISPSAGVPELEERLVRTFSLRRALVTRSTPNEADSLHTVGRAAANHLLSALQPGDRLGVSWGRTLNAVAEEMVEAYIPDITVVPLVGGVGATHPELHANYIAQRIAATLGGRSLSLTAPALTLGPAQRQVLSADPGVQTALQAQEETTVALVGLGDVSTSTMRELGYLSDQEVEALAAAGSVGDIALRFIDKEGELLPVPLHERVVAADLQQVRARCREVIGVVSGLQKLRVTRAALCGRWLDVLVTDQRLAEALLQA